MRTRARYEKLLADDEGRVTLVGVLVFLSFVSLLVAIGIPLFLSQRADVEDKLVQNDLTSMKKEMNILAPTVSEGALGEALTRDGWRGSDGNGLGYVLNCSVTDGVKGAYANSYKNYIVWGYRKAKGSWDFADFRAKEYVYDSKSDQWYTYTTLQNMANCTMGPSNFYDLNPEYKTEQK